MQEIWKLCEHKFNCPASSGFCSIAHYGISYTWWNMIFCWQVNTSSYYPLLPLSSAAIIFLLISGAFIKILVICCFQSNRIVILLSWPTYALSHCMIFANRFVTGNMLRGNIPDTILKDGGNMYVLYLLYLLDIVFYLFLWWCYLILLLTQINYLNTISPWCKANKIFFAR